MTKTYLSNPAPGENLLSGNLVMETGCMDLLSFRRLGPRVGAVRGGSLDEKVLWVALLV